MGREVTKEIAIQHKKQAIRKLSIPVDDIKADVILIDGEHPETAYEIFQNNPNAISIIDAGRATDEVIALAKKVNYVVCSKEFAESVTGININYDDEDTIVRLYHAMEKRFHGIVVITLENKGSLYKYDGHIGIMDAIDVASVDSTGAGDLFHGAFTYGVSKKYNLNTVLTIATVAGGISVTRIGGRNSVATKEEMRQYIHDFE